MMPIIVISYYTVYGYIIETYNIQLFIVYRLTYLHIIVIIILYSEYSEFKIFT